MAKIKSIAAGDGASLSDQPSARYTGAGVPAAAPKSCGTPPTAPRPPCPGGSTFATIRRPA